jgi:hypothetical protein
MAVVMMMVIGWTVLHGVEAQVTCNDKCYDQTSFVDANALIQYLRYSPADMQICGPLQGYPYGPCWATFLASAAVAICAPTTGGPSSYCLSYNDLGNWMNIVLSQCNSQNNMVEGTYDLSSTVKITLTTCDTSIPGICRTPCGGTSLFGHSEIPLL